MTLMLVSSAAPAEVEVRLHEAEKPLQAVATRPPAQVAYSATGEVAAPPPCELHERQAQAQHVHVFLHPGAEVYLTRQTCSTAM